MIGENGGLNYFFETSFDFHNNMITFVAMRKYHWSNHYWDNNIDCSWTCCCFGPSFRIKKIKGQNSKKKIKRLFFPTENLSFVSKVQNRKIKEKKSEKKINDSMKRFFSCLFQEKLQDSKKLNLNSLYSSWKRKWTSIYIEMIRESK